VKLQKDLREFVELLLSRKVDFVVVARMVAALEEFGFGSIGITAETFTHPDRVIQLGRPPNRLTYSPTFTV
jgi:hypothetical protein